jgi:glyoxalase family protein
MATTQTKRAASHTRTIANTTKEGSMPSTAGIHHITAMSADAQGNVAFYAGVLGQRLIKRTVNFDDPATYHLYYGDYAGHPGTVLTFFPWPGARRGTRGHGEVVTTSYRIAASSVDFWRARLDAHGVDVEGPHERFGQDVLSFLDPDGMSIELVVEDGADPDPWARGPVPQEHALRGFHGATALLRSAEPTLEMLTGQLGFRVMGEERGRWRLAASGADRDFGSSLDLRVDPTAPSVSFGTGSVHHIAFRASDDEQQHLMRGHLIASGHAVTPVRDRQYFRSIYFREPGGVLFEIATDGPGFEIDEPLDRLGSGLRLPPWFEDRRAAIEAALPPLEAAA